MKVFGNAGMNNVTASTSSFDENKLNADDRFDLNRIQQSLHFDPYPEPLPERLSVDDLQRVASYVNYTYLHYSANCVLLSACAHYNLEYKANILRSENLSSPYTGLNPEVVDEVVFGVSLRSSFRYLSLEDVEREVLRRYEINGDQSCIVSAEGYVVPLVGEISHDFNAVVLLNSENRPIVHYVDAWKTSNTTPSREELKSHYSPSTFFTVRSLGESGRPTGR
ncbi:T3SS effector cysteine hydrolase SpvD family protein [Pseudomonas putida]|uniref:T3SS effector cysteine hydrolase SpvD family protein n=1 Tax=Pseudomonas putida TaxID=303 RepID=UPI003D97D458